MAKKEGGKPRSGKKLLELARQHQDALMAAGLSSTVLDRLETALRGIQSGGQPSPASQVLVKDVQREVGEVQAAIRKEFPNNTSFQAIFKAGEPVPSEPHQVLALGRLVAREAPDYSANLIRYAINAATVKHLTYLCDQLEKELGRADPRADARAAEEQIQAAAARAFQGKPVLSAFTGSK